MTLPSSGTMTMQMIANELGISSTGLSLNDSRCRNLAGVPSGAISMSNFYGKTNFVATNPISGNGQIYQDNDTSGGGSDSASINIFTDGTLTVTGSVTGTFLSGSWGTPTTAGIGSGYYVRFTLTSFSGNGLTHTQSASTGWIQLTAAQGVTVSCTSSTTASSASNGTYTVDISHDGGSTIWTTGSITIKAAATHAV